MCGWSLYRHRNRDGSTKDWAVMTNSDGSITTRWGKSASRLPGVGTRQGISQFRIERQKRSKGYVFVSKVDIDKDGNVQYPGQSQNPNLNDPDSELESRTVHPPNSTGTIYWHIDCQADQDIGIELEQTIRDLITTLLTLEPGMSAAELQWPGWTELINHSLSRESFTLSGQIQQFHGVLPVLLLMALKTKHFVGVEIGLATEHSQEISEKLKAESELLANYGTDLDAIRPVAELLGLLKPKLNLASAMSDQDDSWF